MLRGVRPFREGGLFLRKGRKGFVCPLGQLRFVCNAETTRPTHIPAPTSKGGLRSVGKDLMRLVGVVMRIRY